MKSDYWLIFEIQFKDFGKIDDPEAMKLFVDYIGESWEDTMHTKAKLIVVGQSNAVYTHWTIVENSICKPNC